MPDDSSVIDTSATDRHVTKLLAGAGTDHSAFSLHFNQNEEFFLKLPSEFEVPSLSIHHDIRSRVPEQDYSDSLLMILKQLVSLVPEMFNGLTYFFDPSQNLKPQFYSVYRTQARSYLYLLSIDLTFRAQEGDVITRGTNDRTPAFQTRNLYVVGTILPLRSGDAADESQFQVLQTLSETWIGETGRGYFTRGIWIDDDLTKFFTKLMIPRGKRIYPYYPFACRYKTICRSLVELQPEKRELALPSLDNALEYLLPAIDEIQNELKDKDFSEQIPLFRDLKEKVPSDWYAPFKNLKVEVYLNQNDMREFRVEL